MKHVFRFYGQSQNESSWTLEAGEMLHLKKVLRLSEGDLIELTNLEGLVVSGVIERLDKESLSLKIPFQSEIHTRKKPFIRIAFGALAPAEMDRAIADIGEFDLEFIDIFYQPQRPKMKLSQSEKTTLRWNKYLIAAAKQSKRAFVPQIRIFECLEDCLKHSDEKLTWVWADEMCPQAKPLAPFDAPTQSSIGIILGSEIGFAESERVYLNNLNLAKVSLGDSILRARTALILCAGILTMTHPIPCHDR